MPLSQSQLYEIRLLLSRNVEIVNSHCFHSQNPLLISAIGEMAINLRECIEAFKREHLFELRAAHDLGISSADSVSSLIVRLRHSYAHTSTTKINDMPDGEGRLSWNFKFGKGNMIQVNETLIRNPYDNELAVNFGSNLVLLKRHMWLAHNFFALALDCIDPDSASPKSILIDAPEVTEHEFWRSDTNDLPGLGWVIPNN